MQSRQKTLPQQLRAALSSQRAGRLAEAERQYAAIAAAFPDSFEAAYRRAGLLARLGRHVEAKTGYDAAVALRPQSADALAGRGNALFRLGRPADALADYEAALASDPRHAGARFNRGTALNALGRYAEALAAYDQAAAAEPASPEPHYNRGNTLRALGRISDALAAFDAALARKPDHVQTLNNRGNLLRDLRRWEEALANYRMALAVAPRHAEVLNNCGIALQYLGRLDEALASYDRALAAAPNHVEAMTNRGAALWALGLAEDALAGYARAVSVKRDHAEAYWNAALALLCLGDFARGWTAYEWRWRTNSFPDKLRAFPQPHWRGAEPVAGRTVLAFAEQGLGDTIQFARYAPLLAERGARVVLEVQPALKALFASLRGVAAVVARGEPLPPFDLHVPLLSLPLAFGTRVETIPAPIPYLAADPERVSGWRTLLGPRTGRRVGLAWSGNPAHRDDHNRSIPLSRLAPLLATPGVEFVSLQKDVRPDDAPVLRAHPEVQDVAPALRDFADTAALISELDLVISVDTAVVHLAGALGRPVWVLLPHVPDWRWMLNRADTPWYPAARLFRQPRAKDWESVVAQVAAALGAFAAPRPGA